MAKNMKKPKKVKRAVKKKRSPKPAEAVGFGILNPYGDMWTGRVFETADEARCFLEGFWRGISKSDPNKFKIVRAIAEARYIGDLQ